MQMIAEIFSRICARTVRMSGKIDSPGVDITNCQNGNCGDPQKGKLGLFKTSLSFTKKHLYTSLITLYLIYSAYICELSTVRAIYQQNKHCFD